MTTGNAGGRAGGADVVEGTNGGTDAPGLRLAVVDGHGLFARCLELALPKASEGRIEVVATAGTVEDALELFTYHDLDVALVDLALGPPGSLELIRQVKKRNLGVRLIGMSDGTQPDRAMEALASGAQALVTKADRPEGLLAPVLAVLQGWRVLSEPLLAVLIRRASRPGSEYLAGMDEEMVKLWRLVAEGLDFASIAGRFCVSERTAKRMVAQLRVRVGANSRIQLAAMAGQAGILDESFPVSSGLYGIEGPEVGLLSRCVQG